MNRSFRLLIPAVTLGLIITPFAISSDDNENHPPVLGPLTPTQLLPAITTPVTQILTGLPSLLGKARDLKLLVLSADGADPSFAAIRATLDQIGTPYDAVVLTQTGGVLPPLENSSKGLYQGIIFSTGNLVTCSTTPCSIALPPAGWATLDKYAVSYGVRMLSYYSFPDARYGIAWNGVVGQSGNARFAPGATDVFKNLKQTSSVRISNAYYYGAAPNPAAGETTTPVLTIDGNLVGVKHRKADGREYLALTFDNNPYLLHSLAFGYDLVSWVTKGVFIGQRKSYYSPQIDDIFLANDLYYGIAGCQPTGFRVDPTFDPSTTCPTLRINGGDLSGVASWQDSLNASLGTNIKVTMAYNGFGTIAAGGAPASDTLRSAAVATARRFFWVTHTYDHENLDCYDPVPNSGICALATYAQSLVEIDKNRKTASSLNLMDDTSAMVTPNVSGLKNPNFVSAASARGIRYLIGDTSSMAAVPHNTGTYALGSAVLVVPRRPTNIFYNTSSAFPGVPGSQPDEYNYFYGPAGISRVGGPGGPAFFDTNQSMAQVIDRESDFLLLSMLRGEAYPVMFHQANLSRYDGVHSLLGDLSDAAVGKFRALTTTPLKSLSLSETGVVLQERMSFNASGVSATLLPGLTLTIRTTKSAKIPVTGVCGLLGCEANGASSISYFNVNPLLPTLVLLP